MYRGAALHGADGEAEGDEVDEQDGGQHLGGAGHWVRSAQRRGPGEGFGMVPGFQTGGARLVAGAFAVWLLADWLGRLGRPGPGQMGKQDLVHVD